MKSKILLGFVCLSLLALLLFTRNSSDDVGVGGSSKSENTESARDVSKPILLGFSDKEGYETPLDAVKAGCEKFSSLNCRAEVLGNYKKILSNGFIDHYLYSVNGANLWVDIASVNSEPKWHKIYATNGVCTISRKSGHHIGSFGVISYCDEKLK